MSYLVDPTRMPKKPMFSSLLCNGQPLTPDQSELIVPWWSFTKTVLAATALSLVRDGRVGLDEPILDQPFTLRQLLRHEAGLADYGELTAYHAAVASGESAWPVSEMMQRLEGYRLRYVPGTEWRYSNVGYLLVGGLIERLTDLALEDAVTQRALRPLELSNVRFAKTREEFTRIHPDKTRPGSITACSLARFHRQRFFWIDFFVKNLFP